MNSIMKTIRNISQHAYTYKELERCVRAQSFNHVRMRFIDYHKIPKTGITKDFFFRDNVNCVAILLPIVSPQGQLVYHWSGLIKNNYGVEFFESFGLSYSQLEKYLKESHFTDWLTNNKIPRNHIQLQSKLHHEATCGSHLICRFCLGIEENNHDYALSLKKMERHNLSMDDIVTMLTFWNSYPMNMKKHTEKQSRSGGEISFLL